MNHSLKLKTAMTITVQGLRRHQVFHAPRFLRVLPAFLALVVAVTLSCPTAFGASFFSEDFDSAVQNPELEGYGSFTVGGGVIRRNGSYADSNDRRYMRTTATDYNEVDFRYEVTFTTTHLSRTSINFIGLGSGDRRPGSQFGHNEPWESLFFRIHTPNVDGGAVGIGNHPATNIAGIGPIPDAGTHRARIDKIANAITFSIDAHFDGMFSADLSRTFDDLGAIAPFLDNTNSRLFFGTTFPDDSFDDMDVIELPLPPTISFAGLDIKPGGDQNPVNLGSRGVLTVALLTTDELDALDVDVETILFGDPVLLNNGGIGVAPLRSTEKDVDRDGLTDLSLKFSMSDLVDNGALGDMSLEALLTGETFDGMMFQGMDSLWIVPPGDANNDQIVNAADYTIWANGFGTPAPDLSDGDFNEDHRANAADYTMWANNFGTDLSSSPGSVVAAVPEPSTSLLAGLGLIGLFAYGSRRRRRA